MSRFGRMLGLDPSVRKPEAFLGSIIIAFRKL
jgi:hypothetical protein